VLNNAMVLLGINAYAQDVANGIVVLLAVLVGTRPSGWLVLRWRKTAEDPPLCRPSARNAVGKRGPVS
jgi:hypothetical protein